MHSKISEMFQLQCALRVLLTQGLEEDGEAENRRWGRFFPISGTVCGFMIFYTSNGVIWKYKQTWHSSSSARRSVRTSSGPKSSKISPPGCKNCFRGFILLLCLCFPTKKNILFYLPLFQLSSLAMSLSVICKRMWFLWNQFSRQNKMVWGLCHVKSTLLKRFPFHWYQNCFTGSTLLKSFSLQSILRRSWMLNYLLNRVDIFSNSNYIIMVYG